MHLICVWIKNVNTCHKTFDDEYLKSLKRTVTTNKEGNTNMGHVEPFKYDKVYDVQLCSQKFILFILSKPKSCF